MTHSPAGIASNPAAINLFTNGMATLVSPGFVELEADHQADCAYLAQAGTVERAQTVSKPGALEPGVLEQSVALDDFQHLQRSGATNRVSPISCAMSTGPEEITKTTPRGRPE